MFLFPNLGLLSEGVEVERLADLRSKITWSLMLCAR